MISDGYGFNPTSGNFVLDKQVYNAEISGL